MEKTFDPAAIESRWYPIWEASGSFAPQGDGAPYCIQLPPPNVTGTLHMGHAFQQTIMDLLIRHQRMSGKATLWQVGTDHAGIATQKIVENQLARDGKTRHDLGREAFIERVWAWKEESGSTITRQMRRLGASGDWSRERFTMDPGLSAAVRKVFIDWYRAGLIYRGKRLVHWDPVLGTAVSDLEVENIEKQGSMWSIRYPAADGGEGVVVATTRPETLLGDVAVAVHPDDARYQHLIGTQLKLPLTDRTIPVIADDYVDPAFGTGCVKITPAHDFNDFAMGQRHGLAPISIFSLDAKVNENGPAAYQGLDRFEARKRIVADLKEAGLLVEIKEHKLNLPISQRSDAVTEPMLTDQWFLDLTRDTLPDGRPGGRTAITLPALQAVTSGQIQFVPDNWATTYTQWLENIQDWCVSRQLWWGHRIPAWFDDAGNHFVGETVDEAVAASTVTPVGELRQDNDVLDTWFSSALWPFSTLGWPGDTPERAAEWSQFQKFLPSDVLVTGFDIIFFWVARMVMATKYFTGQIPFRTVYINAIVQDAEGKKMSKSKGNTLDPLDLIDGIELAPLVAKSTASLLIPQDRERVEKRVRKDYPNGINAVGADALRFTFAALAGHSRTINFDLKRCEGYKAFCNKLWNAARFVLMNLEGSDLSAASLEPRSAVEHWILGELDRTAAAVHGHIAEYRFDLAAQALYEFTWNEYCDWFVELAKPSLQGDDVALKASVQYTLAYVLEAVLRLLHPIIPFITEEMWQAVAPHIRSDLIHASIAHQYEATRQKIREIEAAALRKLRSRNDAQVASESDVPGSGSRAESISTQPMFTSSGQQPDPQAHADVAWLKDALTGLRRIRSELNVSPGKTIKLLVQGGSELDHERLARYDAGIRFLARLESVERIADGADAPANALALVGPLKLMVPLAGLVDVGAELARLDKEIARTDAEIAKCEKKLASDTFVNAAPAAVVAQERQRLADFSAKRGELVAQRAKLG